MDDVIAPGPARLDVDVVDVDVLHEVEGVAVLHQRQGRNLVPVLPQIV